MRAQPIEALCHFDAEEIAAIAMLVRRICREMEDKGVDPQPLWDELAELESAAAASPSRSSPRSP